MNHQEQTKHDKHPDESKTRTHRFSKLPDDGDPWAPNNLLKSEFFDNFAVACLEVLIFLQLKDVTQI